MLAVSVLTHYLNGFFPRSVGGVKFEAVDIPDPIHERHLMIELM